MLSIADTNHCHLVPYLIVRYNFTLTTNLRLLLAAVALIPTTDNDHARPKSLCRYQLFNFIFLLSSIVYYCQTLRSHSKDYNSDNDLLQIEPSMSYTRKEYTRTMFATPLYTLRCGRTCQRSKNRNNVDIKLKEGSLQIYGLVHCSPFRDQCDEV